MWHCMMGWKFPNVYNQNPHHVHKSKVLYSAHAAMFFTFPFFSFNHPFILFPRYSLDSISSNLKQKTKQKTLFLKKREKYLFCSVLFCSCL